MIKNIDYTFGTSLQLDDWFDFYLGSDNIEEDDDCVNVPFGERQSNLNQPCSGPQKFWNQVTQVVTQVFGGPYADVPVASNNVGSFCIPSVNLLDVDYLEAWFDTLVTVGDNDEVTVNYLSAAPLEDFPAPTVAPTPSGGDSDDDAPPTVAPTPPGGDADDDVDPTNNAGMITGIIVGSIVGIAIFGTVIGFVIYKRKFTISDSRDDTQPNDGSLKGSTQPLLADSKPGYV